MSSKKDEKIDETNFFSNREYGYLLLSKTLKKGWGGGGGFLVIPI